MKRPDTGALRPAQELADALKQAANFDQLKANSIKVKAERQIKGLTFFFGSKV